MINLHKLNIKSIMTISKQLSSSFSSLINNSNEIKYVFKRTQFYLAVKYINGIKIRTKIFTKSEMKHSLEKNNYRVNVVNRLPNKKIIMEKNVINSISGIEDHHKTTLELVNKHNATKYVGGEKLYDFQVDDIELENIITEIQKTSSEPVNIIDTYDMKIISYENVNKI